MKRWIILFSVIFLIVFTLSFITSFNLDIISPRYLNRSVNTLVNITINNTEATNITQVFISLPPDAIFYANSNGTSASDTSFSNQSTNLIWVNTTGGGFIENKSVRRSFWFNVSFSASGDKTFTITTNNTGAIGNSTQQTFTVNFAFSAYVKNETVGIVENATVEIYEYIESSGGPPTSVLQTVANTSSTGLFSFKSLNGSINLFKLKIYYRNSTGRITKVGSILPPFPSQIFYGMCPIGNCPNSPSLNGTTFYLQQAATLSLFAINSSGQNHLFGYEVMDQSTGMSIESNIRTNVSNVSLIVPLGRTYTVMMLREPSIFSFGGECNGIFINDTHCPTPPKSNSSISPSVAGEIINVTLNLTVVKRYLYGCIDISGNSTPIKNITNIYPKLLPWTGFVPPIKADSGDINVSNIGQVNYSDIRCSGKLAWYNITLMNAIYLVEFYGWNNTAGSNGEYLGGIYNISLESGSRNMNVTLRALYGSYPTGHGLDDVNVTKMKINIRNSTGGVASNLQNVEFTINNPVFGTLHYLISSNKIQNGIFYFPILRNTEWAKVIVFGNGPPVERFINLSLSENNITIPTGDLGFKKILSNGTLVETNVTDVPINMIFLLNTADCSTLSEFRSPSSSCIIETMNASDFNPLKILAAGKVNMIMKITATNVSVVYHNFDMFNAKPPTNTLMNENASSANSANQQQLWQFGSFTPSNVYNNVTILIPYSSNVSANNYINESWSFNMKLPTLYTTSLKNENELTASWNSSRGDSFANLTSEFLDYNSSYYRAYLTDAGMVCSDSDSNAACYMDKTNNYIFMRIPHFSGVSPSVTGTAPAGAVVNAVTSSGGGGSAAVVEQALHSWASVLAGETKELTGIPEGFGLEKVEFTVNADVQNVKIEVFKYDDKPSEVSAEKTEKVYTYLKINAKNFGENLEKAVITLKVNKSWFEENSLGKDEIALFKFNNSSSQWKELTTTYLKEDSIYYYYESEISSFSYFAIAEKTKVETPSEGGETPISADEEGVTVGGVKLTWLWVVIGVVVLAALVSLVLAKKKR